MLYLVLFPSLHRKPFLALLFVLTLNFCIIHLTDTL